MQSTEKKRLLFTFQCESLKDPVNFYIQKYQPKYVRQETAYGCTREQPPTFSSTHFTKKCRNLHTLCFIFVCRCSNTFTRTHYHAPLSSSKLQTKFLFLFERLFVNVKFTSRNVPYAIPMSPYVYIRSLCVFHIYFLGESRNFFN